MPDRQANKPDLSAVTAFEYGAVTRDKAGSSPVIAFEDTVKIPRGYSGEGEIIGEGQERVEAAAGMSITRATRKEIEGLAANLGVSAESLERLDVAVCNEGWVFPMRDGRRRIVGWHLRRWKGSKEVLPGGRNGLFIPEGTCAAAVSHVSEGESDLAAALDLGLGAIGRPGATACVGEVLSYLAPRKFNGVSIISDRDPNGTGQAGAETLAAALLEAGHILRVVLPPEPFKDLREWYRSGLTTAAFHQHAQTFPWRAPPGTPPGFIQLGNWQLRGGLIQEVGCDGLAVLTAVGSFRGRDGLCRVERDKIGEIIGKSVSTVDRALRRLKENGLLEVVVKGHESRANTYCVHLGPLNWRKGQ